MPYRRYRVRQLGWAIAIAGLASARAPLAADLPATPADYGEKLARMLPGDRLLLAPGDYPDGLLLDGMVGDPVRRFRIEGPPDGTARLLSPTESAALTFANAHFVEVSGLSFSGAGLPGVAGVAAAGEPGSSTSNITISDCTFTGYDGAGAAAVRTRVPSWGWLLRSNDVDSPSTGFDLGPSDGSAPFLAGIIESNLFRRSLGATVVLGPAADFVLPEGFPDAPAATVLRGNVFVRADVADPSRASPNVELGAFRGASVTSPAYQVYANVFFRNRDGEALLSSAASVHAHDNVFVDASGAAIELVSDGGLTPAEAWIYDNTVYATGRGVVAPSLVPPGLWVAGNAIFSDEPLVNVAEGSNVVASVDAAAEYVISPSTTPGDMDFYPLPDGPLRGDVLDAAHVSTDVDYDLDFNGTARTFAWRGAYDGGLDANPGWAIDEEFIFGPPPVGFGGYGGAGGAVSGAGGAVSSGAGGQQGYPLAGAAGAAAVSAGASSAGVGPEGGADSSDGHRKKGCGCRAVGEATGSFELLAAALGVLALGRRGRSPRSDRRRQRRSAGV